MLECLNVDVIVQLVGIRIKTTCFQSVDDFDDQLG
ncbi:hypothetical protein HALLA_03835 (plasmid) [Halostagnicola larsenii XH-48]|uniref:Uncharacterized protein n=1 Tax=Halostagnicola larsenii XH-48 TaxID=797299 RepID=W0JSF0_9EURY|nr:hypothetical protein HALLA_03835 [Halostagnicola larsenii XH-48]